MRFLLKLLVVVALGFVLYHFFGPQMDALYSKAKTSVSEMFGKDQKQGSDDKDRKYYPIEKRAQ